MNMTLSEKKHELECQIENMENLISANIKNGKQINVETCDALIRLESLLDIFCHCDHQSFYQKVNELVLGIDTYTPAEHLHDLNC